MTYKNRLIFLLSLIALLVLLYAGSFIFNSETGNTRSASIIWLDSKIAGRADRIKVSANFQDFELVKRSEQWFILNNGSEYPARNLRVEDFLSVFTKRAAWPLRSSGEAYLERFGLDTVTASRLTVYGENSVLLDLLVGFEDMMGQEIFVRRYAQNEVHSGESLFYSYMTSQISSWYNLRLIPESEDGKISVSNVQRLSVFNGETTQVFTRRNRGWVLTGMEVANPDFGSIESYISIVINSEGDNFEDRISQDDPDLGKNRITVELENGNVITIRMSDADEDGRRYAAVSGRSYVYSIPSWVSFRIFKDPSSFETQ